MPSEFPTHARVVIIGGGIMGCGLAYHLAHEGWRDVVLLEKAELTSGSTWHAAGQITHSTSSYALGKCVDYNIQLYSGQLETETGQSCSWHGCGSLRLAYTSDEMDWLRQTLSVACTLGFQAELVGTERIRHLHPFYNLDGVIGALHTPDDGHVDPSGPTQALAIGARQLGVRIIRQCRASAITPLPGGEWQVSTHRGDIVCEHVVNAGGTYARQMGEWSGISVPTTSMTHHYLVTDTVPEFLELDRELPVIRDDRQVSGYIRMEQKSGLIGIYEKANPNAVWIDECPWEAENELFTADYDRIMPWLENAMTRMPIFAELGIKREVHGAISHPPDGNPLIGPAAGARNYWCCCGTQIGIGWGPGLTRELARWMVHGAADINMREFDPRRFGPYANKNWQVEKAKEDYCLRHEIPFPHLNRLVGRPVKPSPLFERLQEKGAVFEEVYGHERPRWFATPSTDLEQRDYYAFSRPAWQQAVKQECQAVRERAGIMDISAFTKLEVSGPDAQEVLNRLIANTLPMKDGGIVLTHLLNARGRIELETTVLRMAQDRYYLTCAAFFEQRLIDHLNFHRGNAAIALVNHSNAWAALALQGPHAQQILSCCTTASLDINDFRWLTAQPIEVVGHPLWALRLSYAGECGWELHGPGEHLLAVYEALCLAGEPYGIADYGSFAMNTLRLEKAFKGAAELSNEVTLAEADVLRFVKTEKGEFLGRAATVASMDAAKRHELPWLCAYLSIEADDYWDGNGGEAVRYHDEIVGSISSIAYSHTLDQILAFAYLKPSAATPGTRIEVYLNEQWRMGRVLAEPAYDPQSLRPRASRPLT